MRWRRLWALGALLLTLAAVALAIDAAVAHFPSGIAVLACLGLALVAVWFGVRRDGLGRIAGLVVAVALIVGAIVLVVAEARLAEDVLVVATFVAAVVMTRLAFQVHVELPHARPPRRPVLFYNPKSGGGKATRFNLPEEARRRGIEPIELARGDDLAALVQDAVRGGADGLAMAGGDGSQAVVAQIAAEHDLPYACIPAGTRNHFALDLGVDRDDVVGALDAFVDGGERRVDLAEVNGRVFVNNVSLGLYADAVQKPGYREAKLHTLLDTVPEVLGPDRPPPGLRWEGPGGTGSAAAVLISNNRYRLGRILGSGTRPRLNHGELGVAVLVPTPVTDNGHASYHLGMEQWTEQQFEVVSDAPVPAGIDGEAVVLEPPLRFGSLPGALRVRIAPHHPGASPSALEPEGPLRAISALVLLAVRGRPNRRELQRMVQARG